MIYVNFNEMILSFQKLRDTENWKSIASYYIETLALNTLKNNPYFGNIQCTLLFMKVFIQLYIFLNN